MTASRRTQPAKHGTCAELVKKEPARAESRDALNLPCFKVIFLPLFGPKIDLGESFRCWQVLFLDVTPLTGPSQARLQGNQSELQ